MGFDRRGIMHRQLLTLLHSGTVSGLTDGQLLEQFAEREGESAELAFSALVERHGPMVHRVCQRLLGGPHDADDAFQATFLILARRARAIRRRESVGPWLFGVASRVATGHRADRDRRRARERRAGEQRPNPDAQAEDRSDLARVVLEEVGRLPERYRTAVVLCDLEGLGHEEAARLLGCPVGTIKSRQARGRERLRGRLTHRGLAPSTLLLLPSATDATLSPSLLEFTTRIAMASRMARACATGMVPVAVDILTKRMLTSMLLTKLKTTVMVALLAAGLIATGLAVHAHQAAPAPADAQSKVPEERMESGSGLLTVSGTILMPDGSPASGATLASNAEENDISKVVRADEAGRFRLPGLFGNGGRLHASSADGRFQAISRFSADAARVAFGTPLVLRLSPSTTHQVTILSEGWPVTGARVVASGDDFHVQGVTEGDGTVLLPLPAGARLTELVAWHPEIGVSGTRDREKGLPGPATSLLLLPRASHEIRVVDTEGRPVAGLELAINVRTGDSEWIVTREIKEAHVRTGADGTVIVPWVPRDRLKYVEVSCVGPDWKKDETDSKRMAEGITTVHVRREREVQGRLVMPEGANPEGILVTGFGFGPGGNGDIPYARAGRDGSFTLRVPTEHGYVLAIADTQWACDSWSGLILGNDSAKPAEITMKVYHATPAIARVTRGPRHEPVVDAWVEVSSQGEVKWVDARGEKKSGSGGVSGWLKTDANGIARAGVGRGKHQFRVSSGIWDEERSFRVTSDQPVEVEFHRPWVGERRISGRLMVEGAPFPPSRSLVARAWTPQGRRFPLEFEPRVRPDGTFEVTFDAAALSLFFVDREKGRAGFASVGLSEEAVDVSLVATASYSGTLLDEQDQPMADRTLQMHLKTSEYEAVADQRTDQAGRFQFANVPANVPLQLGIRNAADDPEYYLFDSDRLFQPGEVRENDQVKPQRPTRSAPVARPVAPLGESVAKLCRDAHSAGLLGLVVLQGDGSRAVVKAVDHWLDYEVVASVLAYRPIRVEADRWKSDAAFMAETGWPLPGPGEIVLMALDGDRKPIAIGRVKTTEKPADAMALGEEFLKEHRLPPRDAPRLLDEARGEAKRSGRRVWLVHGGPRCGPCFLLARWMDDHHAALEKDFVIVKLMENVDDRVTEAVAGLPEKEGDGIPWFAITEPDGTILATSSGPLGNIGFPSSVEGIRHFRQMLERTVRKLTRDEVEGLIKSLSPGR